MRIQKLSALESMPDSAARKAVAEALAGDAFRRFAAGSGDGAHAVGVVPEPIRAALGSSAKIARLSADDRDKQVRKGWESGRNRYDLVQAMLDRGQAVQYRERAVSLYLWIDEGGWHHAALQATKAGDEIYLKSLRRADEKQVERDRKRGRTIEKGKTGAD